MFTLRKAVPLRKREAGFGILALIVVAVALAGAVGVWASQSGSGTLTDLGAQRATLNANTVIQQGSTLRAGVDQLGIDGWAVDQVYLNSAAAVLNTSVGMFHPTDGAVRQPSVPANALADDTVATNWLIGQAAIPGVGTTANDWVVILGNVNYTTCASINAQLFNDSDASKTGFDAASLSSASTANWTTASATTFVLTSAVPTAFTGTTVFKNSAPEDAWTARQEGCLRTSDGGYVYYNVVRAL